MRPDMSLSLTTSAEPVLELLDSGLPLVRGSTAQLRALAFTEVRERLDAQEVSDALMLIAAQLDQVRMLLERWQHHQEL